MWLPNPMLRLRKILQDSAGVDALIIAGDLCEVRHGERFHSIIKQCVDTFPLVLFVPGNHEYYMNSVADAGATLLQMRWEFPTFIDLNARDDYTYKDVHFVGTTLWFDPRNPSVPLLADDINDFRCISDLRHLLPTLERLGKEKLRRAVRPGSVVITHHPPLLRSLIEARRLDSMSRAFYVNDCQDIIYNKRPAAWFHGHVHRPVHYTLPGHVDTVVYSNPLGYPGEGGTGNPHKNIVLEVPCQLAHSS